MTDDQLMLKYQSGDREAFDVLHQRYHKVIKSFISNYVPYDKIEDMAQETWIKVVRHKATYKPMGQFKNWLFTIARNVANSWYRKQYADKRSGDEISLHDNDEDDDKRNIQIRDTVALADKKLENKELMEQALGYIEQNDSYNLNAVRLRDFEEYTYEEISEILDVPLGTVKSRINRGRIELNEALYV